MSRLNILLWRYLQNSSTLEEEKELFELLSQSNNPEANHLLQEFWASSSHSLSEEKSEEILNLILVKNNDRTPVHAKKWLWLRAAAIIGFTIVVTGALFLLADNQNMISDPVASVSRSGFIRLPDGSKVILKGQSKLEFPESFADVETREVYLTGEAFFDIQHDAKPFIVHTGKINTTVLGTAFTVKAYHEQDEITVTVTRGKVSVSNEVKVLGILTPNDQITFNKVNEQVELQTVKSRELTAWIEKDIFFNDISMEEAAEELSERFHVAIDFENENLKACRFTATFIRGEDIQQIMDVICEFNQAGYTVSETGAITVSGNGCHSKINPNTKPN